MAVTPDLAVDFMDMTDDRHLLTRVVDARSGYEPVVGAYAVVGDEGADPKVARIVSIDARGIIELYVLPGSVEVNRHILATTADDGRPSTVSSTVRGGTGEHAVVQAAYAQTRNPSPRARSGTDWDRTNKPSSDS